MVGKVTYAEYLPVGDIAVITLCLLIIALFIGTFVDRNLQFRLFQRIISYTLIGTVFALLYHYSLTEGSWHNPAVITVMRDISHIAYLVTLFIYVYYFLILISADEKERKKIVIISYAGFFAFVIAEILGNIFRFGFYIDAAGVAHDGLNIFGVAYMFYVVIIFYLLIRYKDRMIPQISKGIWTTFIFCIVILMMQGLHGQVSYTSIVFLMPAIGFMYLLHSNPFDLSTGALNADSFSIAVRDCYKAKDRFIVMYLDVIETRIQSEFTPQLRFAIYRFYRDAVRKPLLFHLGPSQLVLMFRVKDNKDPWMRVEKIVESFSVLYDKHRLDFKAVFMEDVEVISKKDDYADFFQFIESKMPFNDYYYVEEKDVEEYEKQNRILSGLEDIADKLDLNDDRVLTYCQPVYNVESMRYDTAEALMRLQLPDFGTIPPYLFIPLAEKHDLIHELSLIILNKTCAAIRKFLDEGLPLKRISVNFSIQEIRDDNFCMDIINIIQSNNIPYEKIAIEITESRNERDFDMVKDKIEELRAYGIKFYLDDFGTGYSNFERIMELPFDIIKFDRSMVIESGKNEVGAYMVDTFASMFRKLKYRVLYEGIEDENDENRCIGMKAQYLQGYKYSKPIEIERLRSFLSDGSRST